MNGKAKLRSVTPNYIFDISLPHNSMIRLGAATLLCRGAPDRQLGASPIGGPVEPPIGGDPVRMALAN